MLEEMTAEEEASSSQSHSYETQVRKMDVDPRIPQLSTAAAERKLAGGDNRGWTIAKNKLAEGKKEMNSANKYERKSDGSYVSSRFASISRRQGLSTCGVGNLVRQDHGEHVSPSVKYSLLNNSKVFTDSETVVHQFNESALEISEEKITRINGDEVSEKAAKDSTDATIARKPRCTDQTKLRDRLCRIYEDILVVDNIPLAEEVVKMLTVKYRHLIYACDTEV
jgi:DNA polymerase-1